MTDPVVTKVETVAATVETSIISKIYAAAAANPVKLAVVAFAAGFVAKLLI